LIGKLYSVEQILNDGLHTSDESISKFAMELLDDIENFKANEADEIEEIINDKETSILYIVGFGDKVFDRSLKQIKEHTSNKGTALGFLASINFYDLVKLWPNQETIDSNELLKKVRYAKFHAARILKSLRKGEDPNEYDPPELDLKNEEESKQEQVEGSGEVSTPLAEDKKIGQDIQEEPELGLPKVPQFIDSSPKESSSLKPSPSPTLSNTLPTSEPPSRSQSPGFKLPEPPKSIPKPRSPSPSTATIPTSSTPTSTTRKQSTPVTKFDVSQIIESGEIYNKAQKHAKFAISAMNYEDKDTAIKQLNDAIALLNQLDS